MSTIRVPTDPDSRDTASLSKNMSDFNHIEQQWFNIDYRVVDDIDSIIGYVYNVKYSDLKKYVRDVDNFLDDINLYNDEAFEEIRGSSYQFDSIQNEFLLRIGRMTLDTNTRNENKEKEMIRSLLFLMEFDINSELILEEQKHLEISVGKEHELIYGDTFVGRADIVLLSGNDCICLVIEVKSNQATTFQIMQLVGYMIASLQQNYKSLDQIFPERMIGILVTGFDLKFCSLEVSEPYLDELKISLPNNNRATLREYGPFDIRNNQHRGSILTSLDTIKRYVSQ